jgi:hypothetical protein
MDTPVKFEIAKLLKEKGFDLGVINYYSGLNLYIDELRFNYNDKTIGDSPMHKRNAGCYSAPTIAEVVMWLYEKYGIWTVVNVNIMGSWYFEHFDLKEKRNAQFEPTDTHYDSPTEAYEAAIEYTLNNLL